jgi:hypothetical protein
VGIIIQSTRSTPSPPVVELTLANPGTAYSARQGNRDPARGPIGMGAPSPDGPDQCPSPYSSGSEGNCSTEQSARLPDEQILGSGCFRPGGHQQRVCDIWGKAGTDRPADTQQNLLFLLAYDQGPGVQYAHARRHYEEKHQVAGL